MVLKKRIECHYHHWFSKIPNISGKLLEVLYTDVEDVKEARGILGKMGLGDLLMNIYILISGYINGVFWFLKH